MHSVSLPESTAACMQGLGLLFSRWPAVPHAAASELPAVLLELATPSDHSLCAPVNTCSSACRRLATEVLHHLGQVPRRITTHRKR